MCLESSQHDSHSFCLIESQFQLIYQKLHTLLSKADEQKQILQSQMFCLMNLEEEAKESHERSIAQIQEVFNKLRDDINLKESQLVRVVREKFKSESDHVREVKTFIERSLTNMIAVLTSTDQMLKESNQYDLIDMHFDISEELSLQIALGVDFEELLPERRTLSTTQLSATVETLREAVFTLKLDEDAKVDAIQLDHSEQQFVLDSDEDESFFSDSELAATEPNYFREDERSQVKSFTSTLSYTREDTDLSNSSERSTHSIAPSAVNSLQAQCRVTDEAIDHFFSTLKPPSMFTSSVCLELHNKITHECCKVEEKLSFNTLKRQGQRQRLDDNISQETSTLQDLLAYTSSCKLALRVILSCLDHALSVYKTRPLHEHQRNRGVDHEDFKDIIESILHLTLSNLLKISLMISRSLEKKNCVTYSYGEML